MSQEQQYKYFAFISYNHKDKKWGEHLQKKLVGYRMPATMCSEHGWSRKPIQPIFRDKTNMQPGYLSEELQKNLEASRHLIVICSPNSAKSKYVGEEIEHFHSLGRADNIHFFIVDGVPHSGNEDTECLHPIIKTLGLPEILGANIHEKVSRWPWINREHAYVQLITKLMEVEFDSIWQWHKRMMIRKAVTWCIGIIAIIAALIGVWKADQTVIRRNESRLIAEKALELAEEGDVYLAKLLLLNTIPKDLEHPERPLTPESVSALAKIFDEESGILRHEDVEQMRYSPDGKTIVSSSWSEVKMWDALTGKYLGTLSGSFKNYSPDGKTIVTTSAKDSTAMIWNAKTGKQICHPLKHKAWVWSAVYSPNGKTIVTVSHDSTAMIWNAKTGKQICHPLKHEGRVQSAVYSPDGKTIVTVSDSPEARIWDAKTGKFLYPLKHEGLVQSAVYSPDGKTIITVSNSTVGIWSAKTGKLICHPLKHEGRVQSAVYSPDSKTIVTVSDSLEARIWDAKTGKFLYPLIGHKGKVYSASYSLDGKDIVTASKDSTVRIWNAKTGKCLRILEGFKCEARSAVFSPNGKNVAALLENKIGIWNVDVSPEEVWKILPYKTSLVRSLPKNPNNQIVVTNNNQSAKLWDVSTGNCLSTLSNPKDGIYTASYSPDGKIIATTYRGRYIPNVTFWNASTGEELYERNFANSQGDPLKIFSASYSPDGKSIVFALSGSLVFISDVNMRDTIGKKSSFLIGHKGDVKSASYSPDGKTIVTASADSTAIIWNASTRKQIRPLQGHKHEVVSASYSHNGKIIATNSIDRTTKLWDASTGKCLHTLTSDYIRGVSFSPDDKSILTYEVASFLRNAGTIKIWDVSTGVCLKTITLPKNAVSASYSPDGKSIVVILSSGTAMIRKAPPTFQEMLEITRKRFQNRELTREEKRRFYLE